MAAGDKVVINLSSGPDDPEAVTLAFIVADSALSSGKQVVMFLTREAVRVAVSGAADGISAPGYKPVVDLFRAVAELGGELHCCKPCARSRGITDADLVPNAKISGAMSLFAWAGADGAMVFSY